jgi:ABC-type nitrate/sulfonate/bicarbonate transport system substrate-binding protein
MSATDTAAGPPILFTYADTGEAGASPDARWAVRVQTGDDDPTPTVIAYARSEAIAKRLVLALERSYRTTQGHAAESARAYADWLAGHLESGGA